MRGPVVNSSLVQIHFGLISIHRSSVLNCCTYPNTKLQKFRLLCFVCRVRKQQLLPVPIEFANATATKIYRDCERLDFAFQEGMLSLAHQHETSEWSVY